MRLLFFFFGVLGLVQPAHAQGPVSPDRIQNVRIRVDSARLEIRYDLLNAQPGDSAYFTVRSRQRGALSISPDYVRGDFGTRITAGPDRRISWDAVANGYPLNEEIRVTVVIKSRGGLPPAPTVAQRPAAVPARPSAVSAQPPVSTPVATTQQPDQTKPNQPVPPPRRTEPVAVVTDSVRTPPTRSDVTPPKSADKPVAITQPDRPKPVPSAPADDVQLSRSTRYVGPAWALLSAVAPGIGNIFVQTPRPQIGLRPFVFVGCYSLLAYGLLERRQSQADYATYTEQKNATAGEPYYKAANEHYHRYYLATRTAAVVAAADVILTFVRGLRNNREVRRSTAVMVGPGIQAGQPTAVVRYSF